VMSSGSTFSGCRTVQYLMGKIFAKLDISSPAPSSTRSWPPTRP
jgi:hypothetical protein